jgi:hypothetical protein
VATKELALKDWKNAVPLVALCVALAAAACSSKSPSVAAPTGPSGLTTPAIDAPADDQQLDTLTPTLTVRNGSGGTGVRTYDFQVAESSAFTPVAASKLSVPENSGGKTSATIDTSLQPSLRYYWRVRMVQGGVATDWVVGRFRTKVGGYNRAGELYDILSDGYTVGERFGSTTFVPGRGIRIDNANSYVRYQLPATISSGEFSMEVEGLAPNGPEAKQNVFSMAQGLGSVTSNPHEVTAQYRGTPGNPDNCITFKAVMGSFSSVLEFSRGERNTAVIALDPGTVYLWRGTWTPNSFRLVVKAGGVNGSVVFDRSLSGGGNYGPSPHVAYIGTNAGEKGTDDGSYAGMIVRNVWLSTRPRPAALGAQMGPQ